MKFVSTRVIHKFFTEEKSTQSFVSSAQTIIQFFLQAVGATFTDTGLHNSITRTAASDEVDFWSDTASSSSLEHSMTTHNFTGHCSKMHNTQHERLCILCVEPKNECVILHQLIMIFLFNILTHRRMFTGLV